MAEAFGQINWLAVAAATLAYYLLGALWFTPLLGASWDRAVGFERPKGHRFPPIYYRCLDRRKTWGSSAEPHTASPCPGLPEQLDSLSVCNNVCRRQLD